MANQINRRQLLKNSLLAGFGLSATTSLLHESFAKDKDWSFLNEEIIRLSSNENPYGPCKTAQKAIADTLNQSNRYAFNQEEDLKNLIAKTTNVSPDCVVLGHGSSELLHIAALLYSSSEKEMILPHPTFFLLGNAASKLGAKIKRIPLNEKMELDLGSMEKASNSQTSLVYVCNPNNPTGTILQSSNLKDFCESVEKKTTVLVDEAYIEYANSAYYGSMIDLVRQGKNVVILRTFSKIYGLAGLRVGYAIAKPEIAKMFAEKRIGLLNNLGIAAAIASQKDNKFVEEVKQKNEAVKNYFYIELEKMKMKHFIGPTNFVYADTGQDFTQYKESLQKVNLLISGTQGTTWARFSIGTRTEMEKLVAAMRGLQK